MKLILSQFYRTWKAGYFVFLGSRDLCMSAGLLSIPHRTGEAGVLCGTIAGTKRTLYLILSQFHTGQDRMLCQYSRDQRQLSRSRSQQLLWHYSRDHGPMLFNLNSNLRRSQAFWSWLGSANQQACNWVWYNKNNTLRQRYSRSHHDSIVRNCFMSNAFNTTVCFRYNSWKQCRSRLAGS